MLIARTVEVDRAMGHDDIARIDITGNDPIIGVAHPKMIVTPGSAIVGHRIVKTLGLVKGNTIRARHLGKDILALLKNIVGGEIEEYTKMMAEARDQSLDRMLAEAQTVGANAITDVRFSTSYLMGAASEIMVYGNAVVIEPDG